MPLLRRIAFIALPAMLGIALGFAVFRPWAHRPQADRAAPGGSSAPSQSTSAAPSHGCPDVVVRKQEQFPIIPRSAWVNVSDGVNLRLGPSFGADRITTLVTGTKLSVVYEQKNPDGNTWYHVRLEDGRDGWLNNVNTVNYPISRASADSVTIWLPERYTLRAGAAGTAEARFTGAPLPFLSVHTTPTRSAAGEVPLPAGLPERATWTADRAEQLLVGDYPTVDQVFNITLAGGCPAQVHDVRLSTATHDYNFLFLLDAASATVVPQLLTSVTVP